jgi:hypothetical protein
MGHPIFYSWFKENNDNSSCHCKKYWPGNLDRRASMCVKLLLTREL